MSLFCPKTPKNNLLCTLCLPRGKCRDEELKDAEETMSTGTDIYGMTPEERAAFEEVVVKKFAREDMEAAATSTYALHMNHIRSEVWAACAKLYREQVGSMRALLNYEYQTASPAAVARIATLEEDGRRQAARIKELETEVACLRKVLGGQK